MAKNPENRDEAQEVKNETSQKQDELRSIYRKRVGEYVEAKSKSNLNFWDEKLNFWEEFEKMKIFLENHWDKNLFPEDVLKWAFYKNTLKVSLVSYITMRKNLFLSLEKNFQSQFDFSHNVSSFSKVEEEYKNFSNAKLKELSLYASQREKLILWVFKNDPSEQEKILSNAKSDEKLLKAIFENIPDTVRENEDIISSLKKIEQAYVIHLADIKNILIALGENKEAKKSLIQYFLPNISLQDVLELWIISQDKAKERVKYILNTVLEEEILEEDFYTYFLSLDTNLIVFPVQDLDENQWYHFFDEKKNEKLLSKIVKEVNALQANLKENLDFDSFQDFQKQVQLSPEISPELKQQMLKLEAGSYINLIKKGKDNKEESQYFYLKNIWVSSLEFINITRVWGKITKNNNGKAVPELFNNFFKHLINISANKESYSLEIYNKTEFEWYKKENKIDEIAEWTDINTFEELQKVMDEVDPDFNKFDVKDKSSFSFRCKPVKENTWGNYIIDEEVFEVTKIDKDWVYIKWQPPLSIAEFAQAFKERKPKRFPTMKNVWTFFEHWQKHENYSESLKNFELKENKIIQKDKSWAKKAPAIEYFVWNNGEAIQILKLEDGYVDFREGKFSEWDEKKKKKNIFEKKKMGNHIPYNDFYLYITQKKLKPYIKHLSVEESKDEQWSTTKRKGSFLSSWLGCLSLAEIMTGWKQIISSIENRLQTGNKLKSAKFALAMWKFLPPSIREDLQSMVEWEEKKTMEELLSHLTTLDSKVMIPRIVRILENKSSPQYEIEAALFAMLSKYGTLYNKKPLNTYRWSFIWYEALWWRKGDDLYMETKKECEDAKLNSGQWKPNPKPFTEEMLIEKLLSLQASGNRKPKRRSKIHKEMWNHLNSWINDELEDGANKTWDMVTLEGRISYCIGELTAWWYANWLGALEKIWGKWWDVHDMHAIPFVITMTWISKNFPEKLLGKFLSWMWRGSPYTEIMFNKDSESIQKFQKSMSEIVISLYGKDSSVLKELQGIWSDVGKAYTFWNKHWEKIIERMIFKDGYIFANKNENPTLNSYYEFIKWMQNDGEYHLKSEQINDGVYDYGNTPIVYTIWKKAAEEFIQFNQAWIISSKTGAKIFESFFKHLENIKTTWLDEEKQFLLFFEIYSTLEPLVRAKFWWWAWWDVMNKSPEVKRLKSYGIDMIDDPYIIPSSNKPTEDTVYGYVNEQSYKEHVMRAFQKFKNLVFSDEKEDEVRNEVWQIKTSISSILE